MQDMAAHIAKLREDAENCIFISRLTTNPLKREMFAKLASQLVDLASNIERELKTQTGSYGKRHEAGPRPGC